MSIFMARFKAGGYEFNVQRRVARALGGCCAALLFHVSSTLRRVNN